MSGLQFRQLSFVALQTSVSPGWTPNEHWLQARGLLPWQVSMVLVAVGVQRPDAQASPVEQAFPSSQVVPSARTGSVQVPVAGWQTPAPWQAPVEGQVFAAPLPQTPAWQDSPVVQLLPSLQVVPSAATGFEQVPEVGSQVPAAWH